ncbi:GNAT family N-acetyltransferase [Bosea caraganae]|nr:GNAT family N-acetyltransferase [Bosea caraganae]
MTMSSALRERFDGLPSRGTATAVAPTALAQNDIRVELADAARFGALAEAWTSLAARACVPNAFMDPAVALAVAEAWPYPVRVLLAWRDAEPGPAPLLVGAWLFVERRTRQSWPYRALVCPPCSVAYLGTPVVDPDHARAVFAAIFATIREAPDLPKIVQVGDVSDDPLLMDALRSALLDGAGAWTPIGRRRRAKLETRLDAKTYWANSMSAKHRHGFERMRRQLAQQGKLEFVAVGQPAAVAVGIEEFLAMEASGWKGARRSALASDPATALFTRRMLQGLAERGRVSVQSLRLDDVPIAILVVLYSGPGAFTWRVAYDERYRRYSPGILGLENTTAHLLSDPAVASADSCNHMDVGYQAERWGERHEVIDFLIDLGSARPLRLAVLGRRERAFLRCKALARQAYHAARRKRAELTLKLRARLGHGPGPAAAPGA